MGKIAHSWRSLRLPVHHDKLLSVSLGKIHELLDVCRIELSTSLCHRLQVRQVHTEETKALQHLVCIRHTTDARSLLFLQKRPKFFLYHSLICEQDGSPLDKVAVDDRHTKTVIHRQRGQGTLMLVNMQILCDGLRIAFQVLLGESY